MIEFSAPSTARIGASHFESRRIKFVIHGVWRWIAARCRTFCGAVLSLCRTRAVAISVMVCNVGPTDWRRTMNAEREKAKNAGQKRYFTEKPCRNGHIAEHYTVSGSCVVCNENAKARRKSLGARLPKDTRFAWWERLEMALNSTQEVTRG